MSRNHYKIVATVLALLSALAHIFIGSFDVLAPVTQSDLPLMVRGTVWTVWHMVSGFLAVSVWIFWKRPEETRVFAWLWVFSGTVFVVAALYLQGPSALIVLPQWIILIPTGVLALRSLKTA